MNKAYKLNKAIVQFIIDQKKTNSVISCRGLVSLIEQDFSIKLSKSLINNVIKQNNLSNPIGRKRAKEPVILAQPIEHQIIRGENELIKDGGCIFLKAADLKLSLSSRLFGQEMSLDSLIWSSWELDKVSPQVKDYVLELNSYVQANFFPPVYGVLDFRAMHKRFYCLPVKIQRLPKMFKVQLFLPSNFPWINDIVWQEDLLYAINKVNKAGILTNEGEQIIIASHLLSAR